MEWIIALITFIIGAVLGFCLRHVTGKGNNDAVTIAEYKTRLEEKEASFRKSSEEKEASLRRTLQEREAGYRRALEEKEFNWRKRLEEKDKIFHDTLVRNDVHHKEVLDTLQQRFDETVERMQNQLRNVTSEMLKARQAEFEKSSRIGLTNLLKPLEISIEEMQKAISDNTLRHTEYGSILNANIETLMRHSDAAKASADRLTNALRSNGRVQGEWGETVLKELLESQNLKEGIHFDTQVTLRDEKGNLLLNANGSAMRPDVVLHLDNKRDVIIDSKVSLSAFLDYIEASTPEQKEIALQNHVESIQRHVKELSQKDYSRYVAASKQRMGYVIMFVPNTSALHVALSKRPALWREAMDNNVYIADEQTLYAALKIVSLTWSQIAQAQNHERVYELAEELLNRVGVFMEKYLAIGKNLEQATKSYNEGMTKLQDGGHSIPQTINKLRKLGAQQTKRFKGVPDQLLGFDTPETPDAPDSPYPSELE